MLYQVKLTVTLAHNLLQGLPIDQRENCAQCLMPCNDLIQRAPKGGPVQFSPQLETVQVLISLTAALYLGQEPQPLLRKRQRQISSAFDPRDCSRRR
jgi:hypothetical protein